MVVGAGDSGSGERGAVVRAGCRLRVCMIQRGNSLFNDNGKGGLDIAVLRTLDALACTLLESGRVLGRSGRQRSVGGVRRRR